jgi:endo-1,4-beta-D-glucanase Y
MRDRETFVRVLDWTSRHLRRSDGLHSWLWDPHRGGRVVDANTATDADTDIAFALIVAARAFRESDYLRQAAQIVRAIRTRSRLQMGDRWFLSAGNWAGTDRIINLSYFAPYAYEYFDQVDPGAGWTGAIDIGYELLDMATAEPRQLPPDFAAVDTDGRLRPLPAGSPFSADFSFDAFRIPWRVEFDCRLTRRPAACQHVITDRIGDLVERNPTLVDRYSSTGEPLSTTHTLSSYGSFLPGLQRRRPSLAADVRQSRLPTDVLTALSRSRTRYYDANWVWFGLALVNDFTTGRTPAKNELAF